MDNISHIDEKWFYLTQSTRRWYTAPYETPHKRTCQHKSHIPKVMFLAVTLRPRFDSNRNCVFDGKIGLFLFVQYEKAKQNSKNQTKGTVEMKPLNVTHSVYLRYLCTKVLPAIKNKWPDKNKHIFIQQDNAPSHISPNNWCFCCQAKAGNWNIQLCEQPANSPD